MTPRPSRSPSVTQTASGTPTPTRDCLPPGRVTATLTRRPELVCGLGSTNHQSLIRKVRGQNGDPSFVYLRHCVGESFKFHFLVQRLRHLKLVELAEVLVGCHGHVPEDILRHDGQGKIMFQRSRRA